jgi:drug/metabolite transporter (DMT)-like permease
MSLPTSSLPPSRRALGIVLATAGLLLMSLESAGLRLTGLDSFNNTLFLGAFSAISMFIVVRLQTGKSLLSAARSHAPWSYVSAAIQTATTIFFVLALHHTTVANTMVIFAATPALAALIAMFAIREQTSGRTWLGIFGAVIGMVIVVWGSFGGGRVLGDVFALIAVTGYAANLTIWRRFREMNREAVIGLGALGMAAVASVAADLGSVSLRALLILGFLGLLTAPLARTLLAISTRYLPVSKVGLLTPVETISATTLAFFLLHETPPLTALFGGVLVVASLFVGLSA